MFSGYMPELNAYGLPVNSEDYLKGYAEGYEACKVDFMKFIKNLKNGLTSGTTTTFTPNSKED